MYAYFTPAEEVAAMSVVGVVLGHEVGSVVRVLAEVMIRTEVVTGIVTEEGIGIAHATMTAVAAEKEIETASGTSIEG